MKPEDKAKYNRIIYAMNSENEKIGNVDKRLSKRINSEEFKTVNANEELQKTYTTGKKLADKVAKVGGSWGFVITFILFLLMWMTINVVHILGIHFDPYPFILLNLALSCISAIQAPIIMMSQNRSGEKDKLDRDNDAKTNLKTEAEMKLLHSKMDHMIRYNNHQTELIKLLLEHK